MNLLEAIILGILQGLTEFLPVSSSGHLVLGQELLGVDVKGIAFEVFVHFGTVLSVVTVYWQDILGLLRSIPKGLAEASQLNKMYRQDKNFRWVILILTGSIPAGVIGLVFNDRIEEVFSDTRLVACMLVVTGAIILLTRFIHPPKKEMNLKHAVLIGAAQALAILPGISRSGSTISTALFLGIDREEAARYSFLLAVPVILGATLLKVIELMNDLPQTSELMGLAAGTLAAYISGYIAIRLLLVFIRKGKLDYFAWYCFTIGIVGLFLL